MISRFGLFVIGNKFPKEFSNHVENKHIIKWDILPTKNQNGQYEIIYQYTENPQ